MSHPHGIHCLHIIGFNPARWCAGCRSSWDQFVAGALVACPEPTDDERRAIIDLYRVQIDVSLAYVVTSEIERGELPAPLGFPAPESAAEILRRAALGQLIGPARGGSASRRGILPRRLAGRLRAARPPRARPRGNPMDAKKKLTKAEAGRLGGLKTKQRHGSEHYRRAGQLGAKATLERHGPEHMAEIGKRGFSALAGRIGCYRSRRAAVEFLQSQGRIGTHPIEALVAALARTPADPDQITANHGDPVQTPGEPTS
jgi:hypothetical protein